MSWALGQELTSGDCHPQLQQLQASDNPGTSRSGMCQRGHRPMAKAINTNIFLSTHQKEKGKKEGRGGKKLASKFGVGSFLVFNSHCSLSQYLIFLLNSSNLTNNIMSSFPKCVMIIKVLSPLNSKPRQGVNDSSLWSCYKGEGVALDTHRCTHSCTSPGKAQLHLPQPPWLKQHVTSLTKYLMVL